MPRNSSVTREEAEARVEADNGDEDDDVYLKLGHAQASNGPRTRVGEVYHEDEECFHLSGVESEEMTRNAAQIRWKYPCLTCTIPTHDRADLHPATAD